MAQVDSHHPLTAETQVRTQTSPHVICGGQGGTETGFSQYFGFPPVSISPPILYTLSFIIDVTKA
jgi:hypothetical protein